MSQSLPQQMYLLCYDTEKGKIELGTALVRGALLRATAAAELTIRGLLRDHDGKALRTFAAAQPPQDAFLAMVPDEVPTDRPKRWFSVIFERRHAAEDTVRGQLAAADTLTDDEGKALGLIPVHHVTLADPERLYARRSPMRTREGMEGAKILVGCLMLEVNWRRAREADALAAQRDRRRVEDP
ncbi:MAG: GPP34 family phosphoprotein [Sciscionella sp.]